MKAAIISIWINVKLKLVMEVNTVYWV